MTKQNLKFPAGNIILFSTGEYSNYGYCGHMVTLKNCDFEALAKEYRAIAESQIPYNRKMIDGFVAWLCVKQHCAEINATEIYLGDDVLEIGILP